MKPTWRDVAGADIIVVDFPDHGLVYAAPITLRRADGSRRTVQAFGRLELQMQEAVVDGLIEDEDGTIRRARADDVVPGQLPAFE